MNVGSIITINILPSMMSPLVNGSKFLVSENQTIGNRTKRRRQACVVARAQVRAVFAYLPFVPCPDATANDSNNAAKKPLSPPRNIFSIYFYYYFDHVTAVKPCHRLPTNTHGVSYLHKSRTLSQNTNAHPFEKCPFIR